MEIFPKSEHSPWAEQRVSKTFSSRDPDKEFSVAMNLRLGKICQVRRIHQRAARDEPRFQRQSCKIHDDCLNTWWWTRAASVCRAVCLTEASDRALMSYMSNMPCLQPLSTRQRALCTFVSWIQHTYSLSDCTQQHDEDVCLSITGGKGCWAVFHSLIPICFIFLFLFF